MFQNQYKAYEVKISNCKKKHRITPQFISSKCVSTDEIQPGFCGVEYETSWNSVLDESFPSLATQNPQSLLPNEG